MAAIWRREAPFSVGWFDGASIMRSTGLETSNLTKGRTQMITEIALIDVKPGTEKDFEAAVAKARPLFLRAKGGKGFELHKSIEKPSRYRLMAKWDTLENHTVDFRGSDDFAAWRGLVGQYFASPPEVEHTETVLTSAG
jgi:heme-degrading monooxygenase HmoA